MEIPKHTGTYGIILFGTLHTLGHTYSALPSRVLPLFLPAIWIKKRVANAAQFHLYLQ